LTLISGTQTGCRRLDSYIEQKKFLACGPEFSVEFSAPPEFSGGVTEKYLSTGWAGTFDLQIRKQIFYHCATAPLCTSRYDIHSDIHYLQEAEFSGRICSYWQPNFPAVSGSYLPGFSGRICSYWQPNFPAVSVVTCRDFLAPEGRDFLAVSVVSGRDFPAVTFLAWVI
jgi:hypothetical protein